jgi:HlyD family secretion protein
VVVNRAVDPGQTVAASLQVSTLFQIAQDLSKLEVKILVDEADIGQVREGQRVDFTVDAFPDETFTGVVTQVRKQPETSQNVVAYSVIAEADNRGGRLLPGMTANANIIVAQERNVLKAPSAALRWRPADQPAQGGQRGQGGGQNAALGPGGGPPGADGQRQGAGQRGGGAGFGQRANDRLFEALQLDAGQKAKATTILNGARDKARAAAQGASDFAARRQATQTAMNAAYDQLAAILKPEQKTRLEAFRAQQAERGAARRGGVQRGTLWVLEKGKPTPVSVRVGGTDGSFTEVSGQIREGQAVITGGGPKPKAQLPGRGGGGGLPGVGGPPGGGALRRIG